MKKMLCILMAVLLLATVFAGCGGPGKPDPRPADDNKTSEEPAVSKDADAAEKTASAPVASEVPADNGGAGSGGTVAESYTAYVNAKSAMINRLIEGLGSNPDTGLTTLSLLGVTMVDLALLPVSFFGLGQEAAVSGMGFFGATGVQYSENGNSYTVTYTDEEGVTYTFNGTYDPAADALTCTALEDGAESIYSEYRKTPFGYVSQTYMIDDDGTTSIYMIAVDGEDGTIGLSTTPDKPAALTGSETADFPKAGSEWYSIQGTTITGKTSDGTDLNFEYTPTESASN